MATTFKTLTPDDVTNTRTLLYEQIPLTGTIFSGTYVNPSTSIESNILNYSHKMFQTVYDYPYLSSSANDLFDISFGLASNNGLQTASVADRPKKVNIYNQMAKVLSGYDNFGNISLFDYEMSNSPTGNKMAGAFFLTFSRLLVKDEIKKGSFRMRLGLSQAESNRFSLTGTITDLSGAANPPIYFTNSPAGDAGLLFLSESINDTVNYPDRPPTENCGLIFYQAGVVVLSAQVFQKYAAASEFTNLMSASVYGQLNNSVIFLNPSTGVAYSGSNQLATSASIDIMANALRRRISNIEFQNTTELNSTIYFLRINNNEFNYSANPTYLSSSQIRVKGGNPANSPVSYITTAGLYSPDNELLAVAKLSQPLKKTEEQSMILRVRLDY